MKKIYILMTLASLFLLTACEKNMNDRVMDEAYNSIDIELNNQVKKEKSTPAANLMTTAIREELNVDVVFYPTNNLEDNDKELKIDITKESLEDKINMTVSDLKKIYSTTDNKDDVLLSTMSGKSLKKFVIARAKENYEIDIHTSGLSYDIIFRGGEIEEASMSIDGNEIEENKDYKIAFMLKEYGNNPDSGFMINFPGYYYKNNFSYMSIITTDYKATDLLVNYITNLKKYKDFTETRSKVTNLTEVEDGYIVPIYEIQGEKYTSNYMGKLLKTRGVITATVDDDYNRMHGFYLQDEKGDGNDYTSDGIYVNTTAEVMSSSMILTGKKIELQGRVFEEFTKDNISRTVLRDINLESIKELEKVNMPELVIIGESGRRKIPNHKISTILGDINTEKKINLEEGLGFWESLEGMRVKIIKPIVTGSSGGFEDKYDHKSYIDLFVRAEGVSREEQITEPGGLVIEVETNDYNPEVIRITNSELKNVDGNMYGQYDSKNGFKGGEKIFNVGDELEDIEGIFDFGLNDFGSGEYVFYPMSEVDSKLERKEITPIADRKITSLEADEDHVTIATYNIENLGGLESDGSSDYSSKWNDVGEVIATNMKSPDVLVFTEVQDDDGNKNSSITDATLALEKIISGIEKSGGPTDYKTININPIAYTDGGEPGGNIRVAAIYRETRVSFERRDKNGEEITEANKKEEAGSLDHVGLDKYGNLKANPGRVYPNTSIFKGTRKSLAMEFGFKGEKIIVIGNHLNSKGGDTSQWGGSQPVTLNTEAKRVELAKIINGFSKEILGKNSKSKIILIGDFNEFYASSPMQIIEGNEFTNLMVAGIPFNERYTYNYSGNSQAIDQLFITEELEKLTPEIDILYINTDYMGKISDHNPVVSRYKF